MKDFFNLREGKGKSRAQQAAIAIAKKEKGEYKEETDPEAHVKDADGKFVVVDIDKKPLAKFADKEEAVKYATQNHKKLMKVDEEGGAGDEGTDKLTKKYKKDTPMAEAVNPEDKGEYDMEGEMAMTQLNTAIDAAEELKGMLTPDQNLPEWVQGKLATAVKDLDKVRDYMKNKQN